MGKIISGLVVLSIIIFGVLWFVDRDVTEEDIVGLDTQEQEETENELNGFEEEDDGQNDQVFEDGVQGEVREFTVEGRDNFSFSLDEMRVNEGDIVRITFTNTGNMPHDLVLDEFTGARTAVLQTGQTETIEFVADQTGTFEYYCSVGAHRAQGMVGNLIVE